MSEKERRKLAELLEEMKTWGSWELTGIRVEHGDYFDEVDAMDKLSWLYERAPQMLRELLAESDEYAWVRGEGSKAP